MARSMSLFALLFVYSAVRGNIPQTFAVAEPSTIPTLDAIRELAKEFKDFKTQLRRIEARLTDFQMNTELKSKSVDSRCTVRNIADSIRLSNYGLAEQELIELNNDELIIDIVHDVYAGPSATVCSIVEFANSLKSAETKFLVLSAIHDEMRLSGNDDALELIIVANELERLSKLVSVGTKIKVQVMVMSIIDDIKIRAIRVIKAAMIADKFRDNNEVETLTTALIDFRPDVTFEVMKEVIGKVFGVVTTERIIDSISSSKYIQVVIAGLDAVFKLLNFTHNLKNDLIYNLVSNIEMLQRRENYASLSNPLKDNVDRLIRQLPSCVSMFFIEKVCLWNKGKNLYMYAADTSISYDSERRNVFMYAGDPKPGAFWIVKRNGTDVFFRNVDYANEYLYAAIYKFNNAMRNVFTWMPGNADEQCVWKVELNGDYCYLKNVVFNEYLVGTSERYNDLNSHIFTSINGKSVKNDDDYLWQVRDCSSFSFKYSRKML